MMLTTSEVRGYVVQGIRARFGKTVDGITAFDTWLDQRDEDVTAVTAAFQGDMEAAVAAEPGGLRAQIEVDSDVIHAQQTEIDHLTRQRDAIAQDLARVATQRRRLALNLLSILRALDATRDRLAEVEAERDRMYAASEPMAQTVAEVRRLTETAELDDGRVPARHLRTALNVGGEPR